MTLHPLARASVIILVAMGSAGLLAGLLGVLPESPTGPERLAPLVPVVFVILFASVAFAHEARAARILLMDHLAATDAARERPR